MSGFLHTRVYNNNFDISFGYISCAVPSENMNSIYRDSNLIRRQETQPERPDGAQNLPGQQPQPAPLLNITSNEEDRKCRYAKEFLRTVSNCFDCPFWEPVHRPVTLDA